MSRDRLSLSTSFDKRALGLLVLVILFIPLSAGCIGLLLHGSNVVTPHIVPIENAVAPAPPIYIFPFENTIITLGMPVNGSVYAGAKASDKEVTVYGNVSERDWITPSYLAMINDPSQEEFYQNLLIRFRQIRDKYQLSDDEYLELIAVFVQSIKYETIGENPAKFPIETFAEKSGDCDDKSLLLAGLLSHEGYQTALLSFPEESHMAVGISCPGMQYKDTGYVYLETTNLSFVGVRPDELVGGIILHSEPLVIPIGTGTKIYGKCDQTSYIHGMYITSEKKVDEITSQVQNMKNELQSLASTHNINQYNLLVPQYNNLLQKRNRFAEIHNYILDHQYDRKGTFEWVKTHSIDL
ncbi:MAG: hypothetical protein ABR887_08645 [Methanoregulaceae archaeon]